ncbi:SNF1 kinase complex beta-subunit [Mycena sanguinolenta]|uniref:SNF1 kinase complex beta-subunit n=1 Tax=Mycena sanguinolenta TaxID=230812 RepID=A0A8H7CUU6_9AGAR|nr:SNF1 kinase complex beta-subunit [Mycena sanguinolenta]
MGNAASAQQHHHIQSQPPATPRKSTSTHPNGSTHSHSPSHSTSKSSPNASPTTPTNKHTTTTTTTTTANNTTSNPTTPANSSSASGNNSSTPTLRPNRKSIDLPGLNTFASPSPAGAAPGRSRGSRTGSKMGMVERGRTWLHARERSSNHHNSSNAHTNGHVNGYGVGGGSGRGRGHTPPRSAAISTPIPIPGNGKGRNVAQEETGYMQHVREGIARRKREERERRGRSPTRSRSRPTHQHLRSPRRSRSRSRSRSPPRRVNDGLRAPSPSRSNSRSHSPTSNSNNSGSREHYPSSRRGSPSRSTSRSPSRSPSRERERDSSRGRRERARGRGYDRVPHGSPVSDVPPPPPPSHHPHHANQHHDARQQQDDELRVREERERYEQLYGPQAQNGNGQVWDGQNGIGVGMKPAFEPEVVFSTIPLTIGVIGGAEGDYEEIDPDDPTLPPGGGLVEGLTGRGRAAAAVVDEIVGSPPTPTLAPVEICWRGPATSVFLIRAGDDDWMGRREMVRAGGDGDGSSTEPFTTTIHLSPGTHHFRFIVDGQTVIAPAHEIPNAVDDQGFIANYVAVPGPVVPPPTAALPSTAGPPSAGASTNTSAQTSATVSPSASTHGRGKRRRPSLPVHPDGSFWAHSSVGGSTDDVPRLAERVLHAGRGSGGHGDGGRGRGWSGGWTSDIPEALVAAAAQEEAYILAQEQFQQQQQYRHASGSGSGDGSRGSSRGRHIVLNGFVPEPSIPPAPRLPRHLERLILNRPSPGVVIARVATGAVGSGSSMNAVGVEATPAVSPALRVTTASGTDVSVPMMSFTSAAGNTSGSGSGSNSKAGSDSGGTTLLSPGTHPQFGAKPTVSPVATPLIADDPSVLQTPSHAVLYHLCTSSIRDKMIAIGASTRYRQKYLTTVYYKPAEPTTREE